MFYVKPNGAIYNDTRFLGAMIDGGTKVSFFFFDELLNTIWDGVYSKDDVDEILHLAYLSYTASGAR